MHEKTESTNEGSDFTGSEWLFAAVLRGKNGGGKSGPGSPVFVVHSCRAGVFVLVLYPRAACVS